MCPRPTCNRAVLPDVPIAFCTYHVKNAWLRQLENKVAGGGAISLLRRDIYLGLNTILQADRDGDAAAMRAAVLAELAELQAKHAHPVFWVYFDKEWVGKMGAQLPLRVADCECCCDPAALKKATRGQHARLAEMWVLSFRTYVTLGINTTGTLESFHFVLKNNWLNPSKMRLTNRRLDWLLYVMLHQMLPHFEHKAALKKLGMVVNAAQSALTEKAIRSARAIEDDAVQRIDAAAATVSSSSGDQQYIVLLKSWAGCTCPQGRQVCCARMPKTSGPKCIYLSRGSAAHTRDPSSLLSFCRALCASTT